jgi:OOP family OmpA-OmpF porin
MEGCLVTQFRPRQQSASYKRWAAVAALAVVALSSWAFFAWRERRHWNAYIERLRAEPGIVVASTGRRGGKFFVSGLRDSLATDPATLLAGVGLTPAAVDGRWEPYQSLEPRFVAERARDLLRPPPGVTLQYRDGVLTAAGSAPNRWIVESERIAPAIAGVRRLEYAGANPLAQLKSAIEGLSVQFPKGRSEIAPDQRDRLRKIAGALAELNDLLRVENRRARIEITGHTDNDGTDSENAPLSHARADAVLALIPVDTLDALAFSIRGVSSEFPLTPGATDADKQRNRRAAFRVSLDDAAQRSSQP